ncbi:MAG: magnesium transporter [Defluviitaleaceae bacterium]|nr:magnesium transporter [Defluviitaleaceae bacterium]MCL2263630.1 magnesium transporter [Defluviitaleaceae bacterium]
MTGTIIELINAKEMERLKALLQSAEELEVLQAIYDLSPEEQVIVFRLLSKDTALSVFEELDTDEQHILLSSFTYEKTAEFVNELAPDDRVRLLDELPATVAKKLIASISHEEREATSLLMGYDARSAGRIMTTEFIALNKEITASAALDKVRKQAKEKETIYTLFVTDNHKKLEGVLSLKDLVMAESVEKIEAIMSKKPISVSTDTDQEEVARTLQELDLLAIPVVDREDRLVGIVTIDDAVDVLEEETTEDIFDHAGLADITGNESDRSELLVNGSLWNIWKVRLPILLITLAFALFSGVIIDEFEGILEEIVAVAIFIPLIMGMSGNVGTQSSTVFARGVVLGHIQIKNFMRPFLKEILVGFSIGMVLGVATGVIAAIWQGMPMLGLAVGLALVVTMTVASLLGYLVPFILIKLNVDQAAGSAPIITSIKDIVGLVIYFVFVSAFLGHML